MKCSRCGRRNKRGRKVCVYCDAPLVPNAPSDAEVSDGLDRASGRPTDGGTSYDQTTAESISGVGDTKRGGLTAKRAGRRAWIIAALCVLAAAALAVIIIAVKNSFGLYLTSASGYTVLEHDGNTAVLYRGRNALPNVTPKVTDLNADASAVGIIDDKGVLYCCRGGRSRTVDAHAEALYMADSGKFLYYTDSSSRLWAYDCTKKDPLAVCICSEGISPDYCVSGDGKCVVYKKLSDGCIYLAYATNGKETKLGSGYVPITISEKAKYIYALNEQDQSLYLLNKSGSASHVRGGVGEKIWLNYDHSEVVFTTEAANGNIKTLLYKNGKEFEIANASLEPAFTASMHRAVKQNGDHVICTCPRKTFDKSVFFGDSLVYFTFKGTSLLNSGRISMAEMSDDSKQLYFTEEGALYHSVSSNFGDCEKLYDSCIRFDVANNGSVVWFVDQTGALYCATSKSVVRAAADVECFAPSHNGREMIYASNGAAYYCKSSSPAKVRSLDQNAFDLGFDRKGMYLFNGSDWTGVTNRGKLIDLNDD